MIAVGGGFRMETLLESLLTRRATRRLTPAAVVGLAVNSVTWDLNTVMTSAVAVAALVPSTAGSDNRAKAVQNTVT